MLSSNFKEVKNKKNIVFFPKKKKNYLNLNNKIISELKKEAIKRRKNLFLCLHNSPKEKFHNMIIFLWKGTYYQPNKHKKKEEIIQIIEGKKIVSIYDIKSKKKIKNIEMNRSNNLILRINRNNIHSVRVPSKYVLYHEIKPGPFNPFEKYY